jgi:hypothetical protein
MDFAGSALSLIKAVLELVAERRTGLLDVQSDGLRTRIYFDDGKPLFAEDDAPGESFGRLLMRQGVISNDQFVRVIDEMTRAATGNDQLRFGEVAVGLGVLTPEQVERGLGEQVCGIISRAVQRGESHWTFESFPGAANPPRSFSLQINPAILKDLRESTDRSAVAAVVAARPEELVMVAGPRPAGDDIRGETGAGAAEAHAARLAAEQAFQKGMALLRETKNASAAIELRRAADLQPESLEYLLYATWAKARSYREVPTEFDQQTLLEIAHRAKRRDPLFAFGSFVIGQLAMWAGDDAGAKRWFYEALRLDASSEASKMVRILARRGPPAPPPPAADRPTVRTMTAEPPPVAEAAPSAEPTPATKPAPAPEPPPAAKPTPASEPAAQAGTAVGQASKAAPAPWAARLVTGAALVGTALAIFAMTRTSPPRAEPTPAASPPPPSAEAAPAASAEPTNAPAPAPAAAPPGAARNEKEPDEADAKMATVLLPARAAGHRIFVDGRRAKVDENAPLRLRCGTHTIQIGSGGTAESVNLPCGGEVQLQ